ncbi:MAG TPA: hypothetical protein VK171_07770, partial [Fimbriimonas sp.]|nr:hypothetical protein [Fimbriimonas sp.]
MKAGFAALALVPSLVYPCLNDRDTLKFELQNVDALARITNETRHRERMRAVKEIALRAIGGRFERYPDKYYEERIKRLMSVPKLSAEEYDDLAVSHDR